MGGQQTGNDGGGSAWTMRLWEDNNWGVGRGDLWGEASRTEREGRREIWEGDDQQGEDLGRIASFRKAAISKAGGGGEADDAIMW